ncbi:MAG: hypothetical protein B6U97_02160 [Candidatus Altiarchaeales archaeon ex4484_96]|nr:MAG: hypothetical protein B6U97_02160 [Candidatus Altiarchaeales archaeon ex4484_96]
MADIFPFERVRSGQRELMGDVESILLNRENLIAHAPTGIGKTVAVLAHTLNYALKKNKTVFFLTPKHTQHTIVIDTLSRIKKKHGVDIVAVDIVGKQWTCPHQVRNLSSREFNQFCRKLKRDERCTYYNNVRAGKLSQKAAKLVNEIKKNPSHSEDISRLCEKHRMCPYEICTEVGKDANIIVCDYFHIFSPGVRKAFLSKLNKRLNNSLLIVDEAHNLPERVRTLLSKNLTEKQIIRAIKEALFLSEHESADDLRDMQAILKELGDDIENKGERLVSRDEFISLVEDKLGLGYEDIVDGLRGLGERVLDLPNRHKSYSASIARFMSSWLGGDLGYVRILSRDKFLRLSYRCLDPGLSSSELFDKSGSSILMSGTLLPQDMYLDILGLNSNKTRLREYISPFPPENRLSIIVPGVTTKYSKRSDYMFSRYASLISQIALVVPGNMAVFFPAYHLMDSVLSSLEDGVGGKRILVERRNMSKQERVELHNRLANLADDGGGLLLGVQAGSMSEGMDYANNLLDAVVIVGLPLKTPNLEVKSLIDYYDFRFERGWDYGYIYPAMNRALQAAGRCIRTETDKGVIVFMDERFKWRNYAKCFPQELELIVSETPGKYISRFYG